MIYHIHSLSMNLFLVCTNGRIWISIVLDFWAVSWKCFKVPHVEKSSIFSLFSCTIFQLSQYPKIALKQFLEDYFKKNSYIRIDIWKRILKMLSFVNAIWKHFQNLSPENTSHEDGSQLKKWQQHTWHGS